MKAFPRTQADLLYKPVTIQVYCQNYSLTSDNKLYEYLSTTDFGEDFEISDPYMADKLGWDISKVQAEMQKLILDGLIKIVRIKRVTHLYVGEVVVRNNWS